MNTGAFTPTEEEKKSGIEVKNAVTYTLCGSPQTFSQLESINARKILLVSEIVM